jgi:hypothetical protein
MGTTKDDIRGWFKSGVSQEATHLIVVCDTYDWEDYPVYVMPGTDAREEVDKRHGVNMAKVMEVYNLKKDMEEQIEGGRCQMNYD